MRNKYQIITYSKISTFISKLKDNKRLLGWKYESLTDSMIDAFNNMGYSTKEKLYTEMFKSKTN